MSRYQGKYERRQPEAEAAPEAPRAARPRPEGLAEPTRSGAAQERTAPAGSTRPPVNPRRRPPKRKNFRTYLGTLLFLWLACALPELVLHLATATTAATTFNSGLILPLLFALVPALILFALYLLIPKWQINHTITIVYSVVWLLLCGSQLVYYKVFGTFYSAYSMAHGAQVFQFWKIALTTIWKNLILLLLMALPLLFACVLGRKFFLYRRAKQWFKALIPAGLAVALQLLLVLALPIFGGTGDMSAYDLYHNNSDSYISVNRLGLATAFRLDVTRLISGNQPSSSMHLDTPPATNSDTTPQDASTGPSGESGDPSDGTDPSGGTTAPTIDTSPNVLDIDFATLISQADSDNVREVHQYFSNRTPSNKNEKTGLFEGCNLILIAAEAFSGLIIDEQRTPMLYKMYTEGFQLTNYYVPDWGTSTTDGEYAFLTGTIPKAGVWSFYCSALYGNAMPLTMSQQLKALGYNAYAYHGHDYDYYNRDMYLENLGYKYRAYGYGLDVEKTWPESDVQVVEQSYMDFVNNEPFTAYYMSISGHREFTFYGNYIANENWHLVVDEPYSENVQAYIACQLEFERSLELLVEKLEEAGTLENTVFVITPDHYPNGLTNEEISELLGHDVETNFEIFKTSCIIYKPGMTPEVIDTPCSHLDLLPTISNLFGLDFDSRLYMGRDIFSDAEPLVMFRNRSWITDQATYNASTNTITSLTDTPVSDEYVRRISNEVSNRFTVSTRILDYDYWRILFG